MIRGAAFADRQARLVATSRVRAGDTEVRVHSAEPAGAGSGRSVVLLPGLGHGAATDFALLLPMLARRHRVVAIDYVDARPADAAAAGRVVAQVLDALGLPPRRTLVGHGVGALVALEAAVDDAAVAGLVLVAGWLRPTPRLRLFASLWEAAGAPARTGLARLSALDDVEATPEPVADGPGTAALLALAVGADGARAASGVRRPALVVGCRSDGLVGLDGSHALVGALEGARYAELDSGHAVLSERPAALLALVESFVHDPERHPAGSTLPGEPV